MEVNYNERHRPAYPVVIIKKDGSRESFQVQKVIHAVSKSAERVMVEFNEEEKEKICELVIGKVGEIREADQSGKADRTVNASKTIKADQS